MLSRKVRNAHSNATLSQGGPGHLLCKFRDDSAITSLHTDSEQKNARTSRAFSVTLSKEKSVVFTNLFHRQAYTALFVHFENLDLDDLAFFDHVGHILNTLVREL